MYQEITCSHLKPVSSQLLSKTFVGDIFFAGKNMYSNHYFNPQISWAFPKHLEDQLGAPPQPKPPPCTSAVARGAAPRSSRTRPVHPVMQCGTPRGSIAELGTGGPSHRMLWGCTGLVGLGNQHEQAKRWDRFWPLKSIPVLTYCQTQSSCWDSSFFVVLSQNVLAMSHECKR